MSLLNKLQEIEKNFEELESRMGDSDIASNPKEMQQLARKHSKMSPIVDAVVEYKTLLKESSDTKEIIASEEPEMVELAKEELLILENRIAELEKQIQILLIPEDANDEKNVIIEIRAGAGGDEAALFAAVLFRMYVRFAERQNWKTEVISQNETEIGGVKEIIFSVYGVGAYSMLKFESGVHRVQRVPETESSGRVHTSTATVAVLPEAEDVDIDIRAEDLKIDTYRASGAGGQHVNMTDSAVRITHVPSGIVCTCQDERSQIKNRAKAMQLLRTKLYDAELQKQNDKMAAERKGQVGSGDRSERIRTYNYPQNRLSDHRINLTLHKLEQILDGDMYELITFLSEADQAKKLSALSL